MRVIPSSLPPITLNDYDPRFGPSVRTLDRRCHLALFTKADADIGADRPGDDT